MKEDHFQRMQGAPLYAAAIQKYGIDMDKPVQAAARINGSKIREAILAALDQWWNIPEDAAPKARIEAVFHATEGPADAFRARWREARLTGNHAQLLKLAHDPTFQQLPANSVFNLAGTFFMVGDFKNAESVLRSGQERFPSDFWLNHNLGITLVRLGRPDEAIPYLTAAVALRSESPGAYISLGRAYAHAKKVDNAIHAHRAALKLDPKLFVAYHNLGHALRSKNATEEAIAVFRRAIEKIPGNPEGHQDLATALLDTKDANNLDAAIREFERALEIDPRLARYRANLAELLRQRKNLKDAIRQAKTAIRDFQAFHPNDCDVIHAHLNLGTALYDNGEFTAATDAFSAALNIYPGFAQAHFNLGTALLELKNHKDALRCFEAAI